METIKLIVGAGEPLIGRLLLFDALKLQFRELKLAKDPDCPVCGRRPRDRADRLRKRSAASALSRRTKERKSRRWS